MDRDVITERGRTLEEEYFRRRDRALIERARDQAAEAQRRQQFAAAIGVDDEEVLAALREAGVDEPAARLIGLAPALYLAWADGSVSDAERRLIDGLAARDLGGPPGPREASTLSAWLDGPPTAAFFAAALATIKARVRALPVDGRGPAISRLLADATSVAVASGGMLGLRVVSEAESRRLRELESTLAAT